MPSSVDVSTLKINKLTRAQYNEAVQYNEIGEYELSVLTDEFDVQVSEMPIASSEFLGRIVQYTGSTTPIYTNGYYYKCIVSGSPAVYSWERKDVQPVIDPIPSQTGNAGKFLTTDGSNVSWNNISESPATPPTLLAANWSSNSQTINVSGVTSTNTVFVSPTPLSTADYAAAGVLCVAQGNGTLTFQCDTTPSTDLTVSIVIM